VELETKNEHLHITSGKFSSVINGVVADEYPELPTIDEKTAMQYEIDVEDLKKAIVQTKLAVSSDVTRAVLTGVYWHNYEGSLYLAATDGYRLAEKRLIKSDNVLSGGNFQICSSNQQPSSISAK
jgi:DNA polymerase III subunit beta